MRRRRRSWTSRRRRSRRIRRPDEAAPSLTAAAFAVPGSAAGVGRPCPIGALARLSIAERCLATSFGFGVSQIMAGMEYLSGFFMLSSGTIAIMATLLDIYSIGENQQRLTGRKARIFEWFEELMKLINEGVMGRLRRFFEK